MRPPLSLRELTPEECKTIDRWQHARTVSERLRQRASIIALLADGQHAPARAAQLQVDDETVRRWLKRFNEQGLEGLKERPRSGRPATSTQEQVSVIIETALCKPEQLGQSFGSWTLDRLVIYLRAIRLKYNGKCGSLFRILCPPSAGKERHRI